MRHHQAVPDVQTKGSSDLSQSRVSVLPKVIGLHIAPDEPRSIFYCEFSTGSMKYPITVRVNSIEKYARSCYNTNALFIYRLYRRFTMSQRILCYLPAERVSLCDAVFSAQAIPVIDLTCSDRSRVPNGAWVRTK